MTASRHLTVRDVPDELATALRDEARRRGVSLNQAVKDLLRRALGVDPGGRYENGLRALAGTWTAEEHDAFERATRAFEEVDDELWR